MRWALSTLLVLPLTVHGQSVELTETKGHATGVVYEDKNQNHRRDPGEKGIAGVWVSNQRELVKTDRDGQWRLPHWDDTVFFVVKPRGWMTATDHHNVPEFYYVHKPAGSPPNLRFKGLKPTGPLPASIDFPLTRHKEPDTFSALFFGDTQPRDVREVDYIARDIVEPLIGRADEHSFGVTLGDVVFDDLDVIDPLKKVIGLIGIPWYYVLGNHDINYDVPDDRDSDETWHTHFGPNYYSFNHGPVHFVSLDNVEWVGTENAKKEDATRTRGLYKAGLGKTQMEWLRRDLATVPVGQLVVLLMHIPLNEVREKAEILKILSERPYSLSVAAHTHFQEHRFLGKADGFERDEPHHHVVNVTTCGSWWTGAPDWRGVPHTTGRDGAPNGYSIFSFDGNQYRIEYRSADGGPEHQMNIHAPDTLTPGDATFKVYANVFGGSERSTVEVKVGDGAWTPMTKVLEPDPAYAAAFEKDKTLTAPFRPLSGPMQSPHLWSFTVAGSFTEGVLPIHVRTIDMFGQTYVCTRAIRVLR